MQVISARDIASQVKARRKELGWTQAQLAERSGVSRDWIIALEQAKPSVELALVLRTLKALGVQISTNTRAISELLSTRTDSPIDKAKEAILTQIKVRKNKT